MWVPFEVETRRLCILETLRGGGAHTARQLAKQEGCSVRTIWRDIAILRYRGFRIDGAAGFGYLLRSTPMRSVLWQIGTNVEGD